MDDELKEKYIQAARQTYAAHSNDDVEIDDDPKLSESSDGDGCWVSAWVWVSKEDLDE